MKGDRVNPSAGGFSLIELMVVIALSFVMVVVSIPSLMTTWNAYRLRGDASSLAAMVSLARMSAASGYGHSQLTCVSSSNLCQVQVTTSAGVTTTTSTQYLAPGDSFNIAGLSTGAGNQTGSQPLQNLTMTFNSRGYPITAGGTLVSNYALYVQSQNGRAYAVSVAINGQPSVYSYSGSQWGLVQ